MLYINGHWCDAQSNQTFEVNNPATGELVASVAKGGTADAEAAITAARAAFPAWTGQTCVCTNRIYVQKSVAKKFVEIIAEKMKLQVVGNGLDQGRKGWVKWATEKWMRPYCLKSARSSQSQNVF